MAALAILEVALTPEPKKKQSSCFGYFVDEYIIGNDLCCCVVFVCSGVYSICSFACKKAADPAAAAATTAVAGSAVPEVKADVVAAAITGDAKE